MRTRPIFTVLALAMVSLALAGCGAAPVSGFAPVYPKLTFSPGPPSAPMDTLDWTKVDSLQPTLRWEPFPGTHQAFLGAEIKPFIVMDHDSVSDVTYELRIWTIENRVPADLVYERQWLTEPFHQLEQPLKPDTKYYWSVRARFTVNGQPRVTEWSLSQIPCPPPYGLECARGVARRTGKIPALNHYRFKTPPK